MLNVELQFFNGGDGRSERSNLVLVSCRGDTLLLFTYTSEPENRQVGGSEQMQRRVAGG